MQPSPFTSPPTPAHLEQIAAAKRLGAKIRRAITTAKFSGWTTGIFAAFTIVFSLTSFWGILLGGAMAVISVIEFRGVSELTKLDVTAPRRLALNQLAFGILLFAYGALMMWQSFNDPASIAAQVKQQLGDTSDLGDSSMVKTIENVTKYASIALYGSVMLAAILGPGFTAVYYYTRRKYIEQYITQTPQWIIDLQRAGMSL